MSFRRSARRASISACAMPPQSGRSWCRRAERVATLALPRLLARYDSLRRADVKSRAFAVDLLNRSLLTDFLPVQSARGLGLYLLDRIGPLRRAALREGVAPAASQPRLMRGEAL